MASLRTAYDESENPIVSSLRSVTSTIGGWFEETENAQVIRMFKSMDPEFTAETFERELREYIVPEVVDAYLTADGESLKKWCSEAVSPMFFGLTCAWAYTLPLHRRTTCFGQRWSSTSNLD